MKLYITNLAFYLFLNCSSQVTSVLTISHSMYAIQTSLHCEPLLKLKFLLSFITHDPDRLFIQYSRVCMKHEENYHSHKTKLSSSLNTGDFLLLSKHVSEQLTAYMETMENAKQPMCTFVIECCKMLLQNSKSEQNHHKLMLLCYLHRSVIALKHACYRTANTVETALLDNHCI